MRRASTGAGRWPRSAREPSRASSPPYCYDAVGSVEKEFVIVFLCAMTINSRMDNRPLYRRHVKLTFRRVRVAGGLIIIPGFNGPGCEVRGERRSDIGGGRNDALRVRGSGR